MIVVTGASGQLGRGIVEALLRRGTVGRIVASVRDPARASDLAARGVEVRRGDFADPGSLRAAFSGADRILLVSADKLGEEALRLHRIAIAAAREAGATRVLYTSHAGARIGSAFPPADQHAGTEADLSGSGLACTALRNGFYAESCLHLLGNALRTGELRVPEDGPVAWTARDDLAEANAAILAGEGGDDAITPPLTAARAVTMAGIATMASEVTGRTVRHELIPDAAWRDARIAAGVPPPYAEALLGVFRAARRGDFAATDPLLETLLGRPPRTMRDVLAAAAAP
ncbi:MAG: NAD(P)H-binding protein [Gluconacetobacter diazotrophicus]|nr:NAD(P)H-binding protein [Gluconacetobacter diazotrophicus]